MEAKVNNTHTTDRNRQADKEYNNDLFQLRYVDISMFIKLIYSKPDTASCLVLFGILPLGCKGVYITQTCYDESMNIISKYLMY